MQSAVGQYDQLKEATYEHFKAFDNPLTWEKEYVGKIDDLFKIHLYLETDTKLYKGAYIISTTSKIRFLEGEMEKDHIVLLEYDEDLNFTGRIEGDFNDHIFYGVWKDKNELEELSFIAYDPNYSLYSNEGDWTASFEDKTSALIINKFHDQYQVSGTYQGVLINAYANCIDDKCQILQLVTLDDDSNEGLNLQLTQKDLFLEIKHSDGKVTTLSKSNLIAFETKETPLQGEASYETLPIFKDKKIEEEWTSYMESFLGSINASPSTLEDKAFKSSIDLIIDHLGKRYCSGVIRYQNNHYPSIKESGFVIDFKKQKVFAAESLLEGDPIASLIKANLPTLQEGSNLNPKTYRTLSLGMNGIIARTNMDMIYGQSQIVIPYSSLRKKILK